MTEPHRSPKAIRRFHVFLPLLFIQLMKNSRASTLRTRSLHHTENLNVSCFLHLFTSNRQLKGQCFYLCSPVCVIVQRVFISREFFFISQICEICLDHASYGPFHRGSPSVLHTEINKFVIGVDINMFATVTFL